MNIVPTEPQPVAVIHPTSGPRCWQRSPRTNRPCARAQGHAGRHAWAWLHLGGKVREVWSDCQVCGKPTTDGAVCRECGAA